MELTPHFTLEELKKTSCGLENEPNTRQILNLKAMAINVLEPVRELLDDKIIVHSGFRSYGVNKAVGGARNSAHLDGRACDFHPGRGHIKEAFRKISESTIPFDRVLLEYKKGSYWIHIESPKDKETPRHIALDISGLTVANKPQIG